MPAEKCAHCSAEIKDSSKAVRRGGKAYCSQSCVDADQKDQKR